MAHRNLGDTTFEGAVTGLNEARGTLAARPLASKDRVGKFYLAHDTAGGTLYRCYDAAGTPTWEQVAAAAGLVVVKSWHESKPYLVSGEIRVASGNYDNIPPFRVAVRAGQTVKVVRAEHRIRAGTSAAVKLQRNGGDMAGFGTTAAPLVAGPAWVAVDPADVALSDNDELALVVTAVSGSPFDLSFVIVLEHSS